MKIFWSFIFILTVQVILAQSKKEQIKQLKLRVDSLQTVLEKEKTLSNSKSDEINGLTHKISVLDVELISLNNNLVLVETQLKNSKANLDNCKQQISTLQAEIKQKTDSISTLSKEMLALQPPPKPVRITATPVLSEDLFKTVSIGTQVWMTKNLDVCTFRNGDPIPEAKTHESWKSAGENKQPVWCYYNNDSKNGTKYGKLYNWYAVNDSRGLAPTGYHIPTDAEWTVLIDYLGGESGKKMRTTSGWDSITWGESKTCPNCRDWNAEYRKKVPCRKCKDTRSVPAATHTISGNGTNTSGFSGLPGGYRIDYGPFVGIGGIGHWWSSTESYLNPRIAWYLELNQSDNVLRSTLDMKQGMTVRCVKD